jgi:transposase
VLPSEAVQALRALTRARRDLVESQTAARRRLQDELVVVFPELPGHTPDQCNPATPAVLHLPNTYGSAQALAAAPRADVAALLAQPSRARWGEAHAEALQEPGSGHALGREHARGRGAGGGRAHVRAPPARPAARIAELEAAMAAALREDADGRRLRRVLGIGPIAAAAIRAVLGEVARFTRVDQVIAYAGWSPAPGTAARSSARRSPPSAGPGRCAMPSTWPPWSPCGAAPSGARGTSACSTGAG